MSDAEKPGDEVRGFGGVAPGVFGSKPVLPEGLASMLANLAPAPLEIEMPDIPIDDSRWRTADAAEETAAATSQMREHIEAMLTLTERNVEMAEQAREASLRTERFTRRMAWTSTVIAAASLAAAVAAIVIAI
ncbi:hypothetical protein M4D51_07940 [Microbacterium sp. p3-SID338]|uniref:hypothetical protein n=1 Tax=Microbacterium sp. p3-SID338 TaxID=2916214 RepID=UPI0021A8AB3F|nr:hypothetical protein [Microbacterium sp. p3-SID338]MCT1395656.1 hypothetical protein [Microbacterium sp. p3-SID338]